MVARRFDFKFSERDVGQPDFELRINGNERPFHLSFRPALKTVNLNSMTGGTWGRETVIRLKDIDLANMNHFIEVHRGFVYCSFGPNKHIFQIDPSFGSAGKCHIFGSARWKEKSFDRYNHIEREGDGKIIAITLCGHRLFLPEWLAFETGDELFLQVAGIKDEYLLFLGSRQFTGKLVVVDSFVETHGCGLLCALLYPQAEVYCLSSDEDQGALIEAVSELNALDNLHIISANKLEALADKFSGADFLFQGDGVFGSLDHLRVKLQAKIEHNLHVFSREETIVSCDRIFSKDCDRQPNLHIRAGKWVLINHAVGTAMTRRCGLDIVVAAYNARQYLLEAVESLLCPGRPDIRVLIVNDGSTDGCDQLAIKHFKGDARVRVVSKPNGGCASARNFGRIESNASHITFVDADDFVTPGFFADLYDLARYSGRELVQGGFDFYDETLSEPYYASYEDAKYSNHPCEHFGTHKVISLDPIEMIQGQPTIWRRVYRRDFLDTKNIFFPENVRAYDDYIFHLVTLAESGHVYMIPDHKYHYRQHPAQDIKQGDERHFYMLHMFAMLLRRSVDEGWSNFFPYSLSIVDCINWSCNNLRSDLVDSFLVGSAKICVHVRKVYGLGALPEELLNSVKHPDFRFHFDREITAVEGLRDGFHWSFFVPPIQHPDLLMMREALQRAV